MKQRKQIETSAELVRAFADLFDEVTPETAEEIDAELRAAEYNPEEIGASMQIAVQRALAQSPLNWRNRAQRELEAERSRIDEFARPRLRSRAETIAAIRQVLAQSGGHMAYAHRNLELETDEDLATLLEEIEYLVSRQQEQDEE